MAEKFSFGAKVVRVIDGDTALVDPEIYPQDQFLRVRFKDVWAAEMSEEGGEKAKQLAEQEFPEGARVKLTNTHIRWIYGRLEARIDHWKAESK